MTAIKGWKNVVFGLLLCGLAVLNDPAVQAFIAEHLQAFQALVGTVIVILRAVTDSPIFKKS